MARMNISIFFAFLLPFLFLNCDSFLLQNIRQKRSTVQSSTLPKDAPSDCEQRLKNLSIAASRIVIANEDRPEFQGSYKSIEDVDKKYCSKVGGYIATMSEYKPCLKAFPRQILSLVISSTKKTHKGFCSPTGKQALIDHSKCFDQETITEVKWAMNKAVVAIQYVIANATDKELIPGMCCAANEMVVQGTKDIDQICNKITRRETGTFLINAAMDSIRDALDLTCGKYATVADCEEKAPELTDEIKEVISRNQPYYNHSHLVSLITFVHRMDEEVNIEN